MPQDIDKCQKYISNVLKCSVNIAESPSTKVSIQFFVYSNRFFKLLRRGRLRGVGLRRAGKVPRVPSGLPKARSTIKNSCSIHVEVHYNFRLPFSQLKQLNKVRRVS